MIFFTSDTHFGHAGAIARFRRPFASAREMDAAMIARWNDVVRPGDEVWHLGDFAIRQTPARMTEVLSQLAGRKHLVLGNNDTEATASLVGWASVQPYIEIEQEGTRLVMCHFPFRTWNGMYKGAYNLHGHSHGQLKPLPRQVDVGVDVWDFHPVTFAEIRARRVRQRKST